MPTSRHDVQAFLARDSGALRASKDLAISRYVEAHGTTAAFRLAQALLDQVWPQVKDEPRNDLDGLIDMRRKLNRIEARRRLASRSRSR